MNLENKNKLAFKNKAWLQLVYFFVLSLMLTSKLQASDLSLRLEEEINDYMQMLDSSKGSALSEVALDIAAAGLSDKKLFDKVNGILLEKHRSHMNGDKKNRTLISQIITLTKTVTASGDYRYASTLHQLVDESTDRAIRNRAKHSLSKFSFYERRNRAMHDYSGYEDGVDLETFRMKNLLQHHDLILSRFGAEEIYRRGKAAPELLEWMAKQLNENARNPRDKLHTDTLAWYCRVLGKLDLSRYESLLQDLINDKKTPRKIRRHIKKIINT